MIASTLDMTRRARELGFAVPAVNVVDDFSLRAVVAAAEETSAPLIVQYSVKTVRSIGSDLISAMFRHAAADSPVPVAIHLDHCPDRAVIDEIVAAGWSSVLFDASNRELEQAEAETIEVVAQAHAAGVDVESEIENVIGVEDGVGSDVSLHSYSVQQVVDVAERSGADLIAPQLGTAHGAYKSRPVLQPERVREFTALTDRPIVLHGGTGLTEEDFRSFIDAGVSKINISTAVKLAYMHASRESLDRAAAADKWDPPTLFRDISTAVQKVIVDHIRQFGADGKADKVRGA